MKDTCVECGYMVTEDDTVMQVVGITHSDGYTDLFLNNEPYGVIWFNGLKGIEIKDMHETTSLMEKMKAIVLHSERGAECGAVCLEGGLLVIKSMYPFEAEIQPYNLSDGEVVPIDYFVDSADLDAEYPYYYTVMECYNMV